MVWVAFAGICIIWGTTYYGVKLGVKAFKAPIYFSGLRHAAAGLIFLILAGFKGFKRPSWRDLGVLGITGLFLVSGGNGLMSWGLKYVPSGLASILSALAPLYVTLLSLVFFKNFKITGWIVLGLSLSIVGIGLLSKPQEAHPSDLYWEGILLVMASNVCWALGTIFIKKFNVSHLSIYQRTGIQMLIAGGINMVLGHTFEGAVDYASVDSQGWLTVAYLVCIGSVVSYTSFVYVLEYMAPARVSIHVYVNTIVAVFLGWLMGGEAVSLPMLGAMAIILVGVLVVNNEYARMAKKAA